MKGILGSRMSESHGKKHDYLSMKLDFLVNM